MSKKYNAFRAEHQYQFLMLENISAIATFFTSFRSIYYSPLALYSVPFVHVRPELEILKCSHFFQPFFFLPKIKYCDCTKKPTHTNPLIIYAKKTIKITFYHHHPSKHGKLVAGLDRKK